MKKFNIVLVLMVAFMMVACSGFQFKDDQVTEYGIETLAMMVGYELSGKFKWTPEADKYYLAIVEGNLTLAGAKIAEEYLRTITHPILANRIVALAAMSGFTLDAAGQVIGIDKVNIRLLQIAANGFRQGLLLPKG